MKEILLEGVSSKVEEATIQAWFSEEGDLVQEGDDLVELSTGEGSLVIAAPCSGILVEVYYDEGEAVAKGEVLCVIDDEAEDEADEDEE